MPELPEVETSRRGITPHIVNHNIENIIIREQKLRWPVPDNLPILLEKQKLNTINRRGKYLLLGFDNGTVLMHLGMSGSLRICTSATPPEKHDHVDLIFSNGNILRFRDPRKFGAILWTGEPIENHKLLAKLGPEPLEKDFHAEYLFSKTRKKKCSIKHLIMDSHVVVGVGNIYASESLFLAGVRPTRQAGRITRDETIKLIDAIKSILKKSIKKGGTTLKDFVNESGQPGYFSQQLLVYGRDGQACYHCTTRIKKQVQQNRSSFYCPACQK